MVRDFSSIEISLKYQENILLVPTIGFHMQHIVFHQHFSRNVKLDIVAATAQCANEQSVSNTLHDFVSLVSEKQKYFWTKTDHAHTIVPFPVKMSGQIPGVPNKDNRRMYHIFSIEINSRCAVIEFRVDLQHSFI